MGKGIGGHHLPVMRTDEWLTPLEIIRALGSFDLDPCSPIKRPWDTAKHHFTIEDNGLIQQWFGRIWLNPPYGRALESWMKKMFEHNNGIALIFARTDIQAFHKYVFPIADSIFFFERRLNFCNVAGQRARMNGGAPSILIAYGEGNSDCLADCGLKGFHVPVNYTPMIIVGISPTWISVVSMAVRKCGDEELKPLYEMIEKIAPDKIARNQHWKAKIRQTVYLIRKKKQTTTMIL